MPTITRSSASESKKRNCYETETPSIPKTDGKFENIKNKKRKLADELSAHCQVNEKLNSSYQGPISRNKNKASTKTTQIVNTEHNVVDEKKKTKQTKPKLTKERKIPARRSRKGKGSKSVSSSKLCTESSVINISENIETGNIDKWDYNQRRVSKAIEDISNKNGDNQTLNSQENNDHCSVSLEMLKTSENITDDITDEQKELSDKEQENYHHKYFQLLDMMKDLQENFLISQQNIEQHVIANDAFLEEMKVTLEEERKELILTKEELETCKLRNFELEKCKNNHEQEVITLNKKVEEMTTKLLQDNEAKESENYIQSKIDDQKDILNFYKLLTGLSLKKEINDSVKPDDVTFRCTMKTSESEEIKFTLTQDNEFYEVEYKPLPCISEQANKGYSSLPKYLRDQIFFEDKLAPKFLLRLLRAVHAPS